MPIQRKRTALVQAHHLEHAIPAQQAFIGHGDARPLDRHQLAVEARERPLVVLPIRRASLHDGH